MRHGHDVRDLVVVEGQGNVVPSELAHDLGFELAVQGFAVHIQDGVRHDQVEKHHG